jgi:putative integral membrane protein (TIGR02587 family)
MPTLERFLRCNTVVAAGARQRPVEESLREYSRGVAGGLIFSLPLLFTMEVWWAGFLSQPVRILGYLLATYILLLGYNRYAGIRHDANWTDVLCDSVEELGIGIVIAAFVLYLAGQLHSDMPLSEIVGKIVIEAGVVAIGVSVGTAQLGGGDKDTGFGGSDEKRSGLVGQTVIAFCGAILFAANIAPTEEIVMIALESTPLRLILMMLTSMALGTVVLFYSDFTRAHRFSRAEKKRHIVIGTIFTWIIGAFASALMLWFFGRFDGGSIFTATSEVVVLAFPATLGASAGRLLLQS